MGLLEQITVGKARLPRRILLYGTPGIGKSTWAAQSEKPIFLQTEEGAGDIDCAKFPLAKTLDDVMSALAELHAGKHNFKTVVLDSLDWLERFIWDEVCKAGDKTAITDFDYGKGYGRALEKWRDVLDGLAALRSDKGMAVILIAHSQVIKTENPETDSYNQYAPRLHYKTAGSAVMEWCDEVLFASYRVHTKQTDEGFNRKRTQGIGSGERILRTTERPAHVAKNRMNLPDELPLAWADFAKYLNPQKGE